MAQLSVEADLLTTLNELSKKHNLPPQRLLREALTAYTPTRASTHEDTFLVEMLHFAADAIIAIDARQNIIHFNHGAQEIFGYTTDEILHQPLALLLPETAHAIHPKHIKDFAESSTISRHMAQRRPVYGRRKSGELFPVQVSILKTQKNDTEIYVAILRDISDQKAALLKDLHNSQRLDLMMQNSKDLICIHKPDGTFIFASDACRYIGGYDPEELIGRNPYDFFHPDDRQQILASHDQAQDGEVVQSVIYRWQRKDGTYAWMETATTPVVDETNNVTQLITISRDITERRTTEENLKDERDLLNLIMQTSPSGITVVDKNGQIIFSNKRAEEILGTSQQEIIERSYNAPTWKHTDYDGTPLPDEKQPFVRVMKTKQPVRDVRHAITWSDGTIVYLAINGAPILDEHGEVSKVIFTVEDYTERRHQQVALEAALDREKASNELKSQFISTVSHEFRTPMAIIKTSIDILQKQKHNLTIEMLEKRLQRIERQVHRLDQMLEEITTISHDNHTDKLPNPVLIDLPLFFDELAEEMKSAYPEHHPAEFRLQGGCLQITFDLQALQHILINLLGNALKYSANDTAVTCTCICDDTHLTLTIEDHGIGIPAEAQPQIFEEFYRANNVRELSGTGLGLAIAHRAVQRLNGHIHFTSQPGVGTTFTVRLPLHQPAK